MGAIVFDNQVFDSWLTKKSQEILSKVDRERITTEEMLILILKAQTNHFHHMDLEFREEFSKINEKFDRIDEKFEKIDERFMAIARYFEKFGEQFRKTDERFEGIEKRFDRFDSKFERLWDFQKWQGGILLALFAGIYLKLFLG